MASFLQNNLDILVDLWSRYSSRIITVIVIIVIGIIITKVMVKLIKKFFDKANFDRTVEVFIEHVAEVLLWTVLTIVILSNLGINVAGLIAGLGIAGIIVGFALQDTLSNLASGVFILFNKPFKIDDWIRVGGIVGCVEKISLAACTLKSPDNIKITIPNSKIWGGVIENFTGNPTRKIFNLEVGISYDSNIDKAMKIINDILKKDKRVLKDPPPQIVVKSLGDNSVNIAVRPGVGKDDYWALYFDLIKAIKEEFDKNGISIPFPQRDVWIREMSQGKKK